ncbi:hypothetical protein LEP1GSC170_3305 [Leptospira interrogans serovar Bataviae str. HAI135]|nr:hypothetical protein LEP1GSC170_3305 [Leptospira interrogans serovar Bataviae str. HAI135]
MDVFFDKNISGLFFGPITQLQVFEYSHLFWHQFFSLSYN